MNPRAALKGIDPNVITSSSAHHWAVSSENDAIDKLSLSSNGVHHTSYVERDEYHKTCKERDTLVEEVRRLTRELSRLQDSDQTSTWQKITASTREMRRMEDETRDLKAHLEDNKVSFSTVL